MALDVLEKPKKRQTNPKSDAQKLLKQVRAQQSKHVVEVELAVSVVQKQQLLKINEHLRVIRNTVLGQVKKNYDQMVRTKKYKKNRKQYQLVRDSIKTLQEKQERFASTFGARSKEVSAVKKELKLLEAQKKGLWSAYEEMQKEFDVTFEFVRKYGEALYKTRFQHPDSVTVLSVCENVWAAIEKLLERKASKVRFYKKGEWVTFQGKQANRCIILKQDKNKQFYISFSGLQIPLKVKKNDLFVEETLSKINHYLHNAEAIEQENTTRSLNKQPLISTFRVLNNRIVVKEIRGKVRFYLQMVLEGSAAPKRKKDGTFRHTLGTGRIGIDIGTQSVAIVSQDRVVLKNLAERSDRAFKTEQKIVLLQRQQDRSRRATNPENYDEKGRIVKGCKTWKQSKRYKRRAKRLRNLHRIAASNREYSHNEDVNFIRSLGDFALVEQMDFKALQKKAKEATKNEKTGKWNRRKRFGKSILRRSPGYFVTQTDYRFDSTEACMEKVNTWTFKASQYDHMLKGANKKQLSQRWHTFEDGIKIQRDLYSAFLLYCADDDLKAPDQTLCEKYFGRFLELHNQCIEQIKKDRKVVLNSGIKISAV